MRYTWLSDAEGMNTYDCDIGHDRPYVASES